MSTPSKKSRPVRTTFPNVFYTTQTDYKQWCQSNFQPRLWLSIETMAEELGDLEKVDVIRVSYPGTPAKIELGNISLQFSFNSKEKESK